MRCAGGSRDGVAHRSPPNQSRPLAEAGEHIVCDRDEYFLTHRLSSEPARWLGALDRRTLGPSGLLQLKPPNMPIRVKLAPSWQRISSAPSTRTSSRRPREYVATGMQRSSASSATSKSLPHIDPAANAARGRKARPASKAILEPASQLLLAELGNHWLRGREAASREIRMGGLAPWRLRAVKERIEALNLGTPRIDELARLCGLSSFT